MVAVNNHWSSQDLYPTTVTAKCVIYKGHHVLLTVNIWNRMGP